jgi:multiple sugar transport system ATP-binding protein
MNLIETEEYIFGFHPEHFHPQDAQTGIADRVVIPFEVTRIEYLGAERHVYGTVRSVKGKTEVVARLPGTIPQSVAAGETYDFVVDAVNLSYFNRRTNLRMGAPSRVAY